MIFYYSVLVKPLDFPVMKKIAALLSAVIFTIVYIMAENVARYLAQGRLITGVHVPEFIFLVISFLAFVLIILAHRK